MEIVYNILETIIPFDFIDYAFMKKCFISSITNITDFCNFRNNGCK